MQFAIPLPRHPAVWGERSGPYRDAGAGHHRRAGPGTGHRRSTGPDVAP